MLPFVEYHYKLAENLLEYADSEKDLGVYITRNFTSHLLTSWLLNIPHLGVDVYLIKKKRKKKRKRKKEKKKK